MAVEFFIGNKYCSFGNSHGNGFQVKSYSDKLSIFAQVTLASQENMNDPGFSQISWAKTTFMGLDGLII